MPIFIDDSEKAGKFRKTGGRCMGRARICAAIPTSSQQSADMTL
jgi:hypothetical protein